MPWPSLTLRECSFCGQEHRLAGNSIAGILPMKTHALSHRKTRPLPRARENVVAEDAAPLMPATRFAGLFDVALAAGWADGSRCAARRSTWPAPICRHPPLKMRALLSSENALQPYQLTQSCCGTTRSILTFRSSRPGFSFAVLLAQASFTAKHRRLNSNVRILAQPRKPTRSHWIDLPDWPQRCAVSPTSSPQDGGWAGESGVDERP